MPRQAARGLMWLTLAFDAAGAEDGSIRKAYEDAVRKTSEDDRIIARSYLEQHLRANRGIFDAKKSKLGGAKLSAAFFMLLK